MSRRSKGQKSKSPVVSGDLLPPEPAAVIPTTSVEPLPPAKKRAPRKKAASKENHEPVLLTHVVDTPKEAALPLAIDDALQTLTRLHETAHETTARETVASLPASDRQSAEAVTSAVAAPAESSAPVEDAAGETTILQPPSAPPLASAGEMLKKARETAGLSIDEVSHSLKLAPRQVLALEQQDFAALPARAFVRGFMRNYARLLNIDTDAILAALPSEAPQEISLAASSVENPTHATPALPYGEGPSLFRSHFRKWLIVAAAAILVLAAAAFFFQPQIAQFFDKDGAQLPGASDTVSSTATDGIIPPPSEGEDNDNVRTVSPIIAALPDAPSPIAAPPMAPVPETASPAHNTTASTSPSTPPPATATPVESATSPADLVLRLTGESWIEVRDGHGKIIYAALAKAGSEKALHGTPPFSLVLGNSAVVAIERRGKNVDLSAYAKQGVARLTLE